MIRRRFARVAAATLLALTSAGAAVQPAQAAEAVTFGVPTASSSFGKSIAFEQPVVLADTPRRVELLLRTPGAFGPSVVDVETPAARGNQTLRFQLDLADGHIFPNTTFTAFWRVTAADGSVSRGPDVSETYADDRVSWKTLEGDIVRLHWYDGDQAFAQRALRIADAAVADTAELLGVTETEPIDFFVYGDQGQFLEALGPGAREWSGAQAHPEIRTMFANIGPQDDQWGEVAIFHELVHLVFATATDNKLHGPPHWLNEGLAVYLSEGYTASYRADVERAAADGTLIPLDGISGAFPTDRTMAGLAYGESVSAVDFMVRAHAREDLIALIRSYATGVSDDEAFQAALGVDVAGFEAEWLADLGAKPPVRHGPQPAPPGPVPEGWSGAAPNPSVAPGSGSAPTPGANQPGPGASGAESATVPILAAIVLAVVISVGLVLLVVARRRSAAGP